MDYTYTTDSRNIKYKTYKGTAYHIDTPDEIVSLLHTARENNTRLKVYYGDTKTGRYWGDVEVGYIGRSTGSIKIPLSIYNARSMGGGALLDDCIVQIDYANKKQGGTLYQLYKQHERHNTKIQM